VNNINSNIDIEKLYNKIISQRASEKEKKKETTDILNKPPMRYLAYSNEIGAAISPINKSLGTALWAPALLYLGADIYDKYKNEDNTYNPSAKRSLRQAIFQGLASVILPTAVIKLGQKIGVRISTGKETLSAIDKKELIDFTIGYLDNATFPQKEGETFAHGLIEAFNQKASARKAKIKNRTLKDRFFSIFKESKDYDNAISKYLKDKAKQNHIISYLEAQGKIVDDIMKSEKNIQADKYIKFFNETSSKYGDVQLAKFETISKLLKDKTINKSLIATLSGFIALFLMIKPIDFFTEKIMMEKIVNPIFDKFPTKNNKEKSEK